MISESLKDTAKFAMLMVTSTYPSSTTCNPHPNIHLSTGYQSITHSTVMHECEGMGKQKKIWLSILVKCVIKGLCIAICVMYRPVLIWVTLVLLPLEYNSEMSLIYFNNTVQSISFLECTRLCYSGWLLLFTDLHHVFITHHFTDTYKLF